MIIPLPDLRLAQRVCIAGGPRVGKSTLARELASRFPPIHADDFIDKMAWSEVSEHIAGLFANPGPWLIEGTAVVRALRKWLVAKEEAEALWLDSPLYPCDKILWMNEHVFAELSPGQDRMRKACDTIWREVRDRLLARGVAIFELVARGGAGLEWRSPARSQR